MVTLLLLGFALSLDSFRVSLGLGTLKLSRLRQLQIVIAFGVCDALAPLIGLLIGHSLLEFIGPWVEHLGPLLLCAYGVNVLIGKGGAAFGWQVPHAGDLAEFLTVLAAMVLFVTGLMRNETGSRSPDNS